MAKDRHKRVQGDRRCHRGVEWQWEGVKGRLGGVKDRWIGVKILIHNLDT